MLKIKEIVVYSTIILLFNSVEGNNGNNKYGKWQAQVSFLTVPNSTASKATSICSYPVKLKLKYT